MKFESDIRKNLGRLPRTLKESYDQIYSTIESEEGDAPRIAKVALQWIMGSARPLRPDEWVDAIYYTTGIDSKSSLGTVLDICHNLVVEDKQSKVMRFSHLSVQEYLENREEFGISKVHSMVAQACLSVQIDLVQPNSAESRDHFLCYSNDHWAYHIHQCNGSYERDAVLGLLRSFLGSPIEPGKAYFEWFNRFNNVKTYGYDILSLGLVDHLKSSPLSPLFAAAYFRLWEVYPELWEWDTFDIDCRNTKGGTPLYVATYQGHSTTVKILLDRKADTNSGKTRYARNPLMVAIKNYSVPVVNMLLDHGADVRANGCRYLAIERAASAEGDEAVLAAVLARYADIEITEAVLKAAAGNKNKSKEVMKLLLARDSNIKITKAVLTAAAAAAAAGNWHGKDVMELLLARDANIEITEAVLTTAAAGNWHGKDVMELLLARDANIEITEAVLTAAAGNWRSKDVMELLLARDANIEITEAVLTAAAGNSNGKDVMELLLARDTNIEVTEAMVVAATANKKGDEIMELLSQYPTAPVSLAAAKAAAYFGKYSWFQWLLAKYDKLYVTDGGYQQLLCAAVEGGSQHIIKSLLMLCKPYSGPDNYDWTLPMLATQSRNTWALQLFEDVHFSRQFPSRLNPPNGWSKDHIPSVMSLEDEGLAIAYSGWYCTTDLQLNGNLGSIGTSCSERSFSVKGNCPFPPGNLGLNYYEISILQGLENW